LSYEIVRPEFRLEIAPPEVGQPGVAIVLCRPNDDTDPAHWTAFLWDYMEAWEGVEFDKPEDAENAARKAVLLFLDSIGHCSEFTPTGNVFIHAAREEAFMLTQEAPPT